MATRTLNLRRMQGEWTAQLAALDSQDPEVAKSFVQAIIDLSTLIRDLGRSRVLPVALGAGDRLTSREPSAG